MKLVERSSGKPIEVPDEQLEAALTSGQYGAPRGTRIPVRFNGEVGSVPIEKLDETLANGGSVVSQAEYDKAALQKEYGDVGHGAEALGTQALGTATLGASDVALGALGGAGVRQSIRKSQEANPAATGVGTAVGIVGPVVADVLSGGAATPAVAEALAGAGERAAAGTEARALAAGPEVRGLLGRGAIPLPERGAGVPLLGPGAAAETAEAATPALPGGRARPLLPEAPPGEPIPLPVRGAQPPGLTAGPEGIPLPTQGAQAPQLSAPRVAAKAADNSEVAGLRSMQDVRIDSEGMRDESLDVVRKERSSGKQMRPVEISVYPGEPPVLIDGRHRLAVAHELGDDSIDVLIRQYDNEASQIAPPIRTRLPLRTPGTGALARVPPPGALAQIPSSALDTYAPRALGTVPQVQEGVLEGFPRLPPIPEELAGEVIPQPGALPGGPSRLLGEGGFSELEGAEADRYRNIAARRWPGAASAAEDVGERALETPSLARVLGIEPPASRFVAQASTTGAAEDAARVAAETTQAVQDAAHTAEEAVVEGGTAETAAAREAGKGVVRKLVGDAILGPTRLVQGAGEAVEAAVRKALGAEAESAIGRIAQKAVISAARGAAEGGLYGVGNEIGHQFLQDDPDLNGERLATAWFHGALLGGAFGGSLGALGQGSKEALAKAVGNEGVAAYLTKKSGELTWHAAGPTKAMTAEADRYAGGVSKVGNLIREDAQQLLGRMPRSREELLELSEKMQEKHTSALDAVLDRLDNTANTPERVKLGAVLRDIDGVLKDLRARAAPTGQLDAFRDRVIDALGARDELTGDIDKSVTLSFRQLRDIRTTADEMAKFNPYPGTDTVPQVAAKAVRAKLEERITEVADRLANESGGSLLKDYRAAKQGYQAAKLLEKAAARGTAGEKTNQFFSLTDKIAAAPAAVTGAAIGHALGGAPGAFVGHAVGHAIGEVASKQIRKNFDFVVSDVLAKLANVAKGEHVLNAAQKANEQVQRRMDKGMDAVSDKLHGKAAGAAPPRSGPKTFDERREQVLNLAAQHEAVAGHLQNVTTPLDRAAPDVASSLTSASLRGLTYLVDALPKPPPQTDALTPRLDEKAWEPSAPQQAAYNRKYDVVAHPDLLPWLIANGALTSDHVAAMDAAHPKQAAKLRAGMVKQLDELAKPVPADMRSSVKLFLGMPRTEPSLGRMLQSAYQTPKPPTAPRRPLKMADSTSLNKQTTL